MKLPQDFKDSAALLDSDFPLDPLDIGEIQALLKSFEEHDPESYSFRYPFGRKGRTHPKLTNVNLATLRISVRKTFDLITTVLEPINYCLQDESER